MARAGQQLRVDSIRSSSAAASGHPTSSMSAADLMAVLSPSCFFTGCCAGRCTASRWGIWSSDRRIGARRVPTQLLEAAAGLLLAATAGVLFFAPVPDGVVFIGGAAAYIAARQFLLPLRAESRQATPATPDAGAGRAHPRRRSRPAHPRGSVMADVAGRRSWDR